VLVLVAFYGFSESTAKQELAVAGAMSIKLRELIRSIRACKTAAEAVKIGVQFRSFFVWETLGNPLKKPPKRLHSAYHHKNP
jgi:hypothetical protein